MKICSGMNPFNPDYIPEEDPAEVQEQIETDLEQIGDADPIHIYHEES